MAPTFRSKNFALIALMAFIGVAVFCVWSGAAMSMEESNMDCMLGSEMALCGTSAQKHISVWHNFLSVIPQKTFNLALIILLFVFVLTSIIYRNRFIRSRAPEIARRLNAKLSESLGIIDPIRRALSDGIIQPKIFEPAIL